MTRAAVVAERQSPQSSRSSEGLKGLSSDLNTDVRKGGLEGDFYFWLKLKWLEVPLT